MIFVTVGAQMPFDRLVKTVDQWACERGRDDVFAQIGMTDYRPSNIQWTDFLTAEEFKQRFEAANVIVAHAGTGSIITALQLGKPILIMGESSIILWVTSEPILSSPSSAVIRSRPWIRRREIRY